MVLLSPSWDAAGNSLVAQKCLSTMVLDSDPQVWLDTGSIIDTYIYMCQYILYMIYIVYIDTFLWETAAQGEWRSCSQTHSTIQQNPGFKLAWVLQRTWDRAGTDPAGWIPRNQILHYVGIERNLAPAPVTGVCMWNGGLSTQCNNKYPVHVSGDPAGDACAGWAALQVKQHWLRCSRTAYLASSCGCRGTHLLQGLCHICQACVAVLMALDASGGPELECL